MSGIGRRSSSLQSLRGNSFTSPRLQTPMFSQTAPHSSRPRWGRLQAKDMPVKARFGSAGSAQVVGQAVGALKPNRPFHDFATCHGHTEFLPSPGKWAKLISGSADRRILTGLRDKHNSDSVNPASGCSSGTSLFLRAQRPCAAGAGTSLRPTTQVAGALHQNSEIRPCSSGIGRIKGSWLLAPRLRG